MTTGADPTLTIKLDKAVYCQEGFCGVISHLIIDPTGFYLTRLVIKPAHLPPPASLMERLVPLSQIATSTHDGLWLKCAMDEFWLFSPFLETHFKQINIPTSSLWGTDFSPVLSIGTDWLYVPVIKHNILPGETIIDRQMQIESPKGHLGQFEGFIIQAATSEISHLIFLCGHIWELTTKTVPAAMIETIEGDVIYLKTGGNL